MQHMVIFRTAEGKPGYHQSESLDDAVRFVEHLRNQEGVTDARIFRLQEVPIEVKAYFRVEVAALEPEVSRPVPEVDKPERFAPGDDPIVVEANPSPSAAAARFGRFNRG